MIVLTCKSENKSAAKLELPTYLYELPVEMQNEIILRWGFGGWPSYKREINKAGAIELNCHKYMARRALEKVVRIPKTYGPRQLTEDKRYVVRPFYHAKGKDFKIQQGPFEVEVEHYASEYLETDSEYRAWFCGDNIKVARRAPMEGQTGACRSKFGYEWKSTQRTLRDYVLLAKKAIGLDTGAADVLLHQGKWYFLELNSAPCLDHWRLQEFFKTHIKEFDHA